MIYRNDNIIETSDYIGGTIKDLREYFRYKIASLCMTREDEQEDFTNTVREICDLLDNLEEDEQLYEKSDILYVFRGEMGNFYIKSEVQKMNLTIDEKERLLHKATNLYEKIKSIDIKSTVELSLTCKYYPKNLRSSDKGFKYYVNSKTIYVHGLDVEEFLKELNNYIMYKKYNGDEYVDGKSVSYISDYDLLVLLDFIYYSDYILNKVNEINEKTIREIEELLS